jgi:hypothetical protein
MNCEKETTDIEDTVGRFEVLLRFLLFCFGVTRV